MKESIRLRADQLEWREVDGEIVALDLRAETYFAVNRTGAAIWHDLVEGATREQLIASLVDRFTVDSDTAGRDLDAFLEDCRRSELLL